jgi:hypothetical protein
VNHPYFGYICAQLGGRVSSHGGHGSRMAWRIDEHVVHGEIDNRIRGRITGRIWFEGREAPVELELEGNAWRDLAGRRLEFRNPRPKPGNLQGLRARQAGVIGDCTASRKVKVPEIPMDKIGEYYAAGRKWPWHWGNSLYLEWFSQANGRVVIESAEFELTVGPEIAWEMSESGELEQRTANGAAMTRFMERMVELLESQQSAAPGTAPGETPDRDDPFRPPPMTEEEAEKMQEDSDRLNDRIQARLDREGPDADHKKILEEELERRARERGDRPPTPEEEAKRAEWIDEMNRAAEEALANPDPELEELIHRKHPVAEQAFELSIRLHRAAHSNNWVPEGANQEHPVAELVGSVSCASAKMAGALNGRAWPPSVSTCANEIVRLKRARGYLDDALLALGSCKEEKLIDSTWLAGVEREVGVLARECDALLAELRENLARGFD